MKPITATLCIAIFLLASPAIVTADDAPKSKKATDAIAKHDAAVARAAQAYWKACAAADKQLADDLTTAENVAKKTDAAEAKAIADAITDVNSRKGDELGRADGTLKPDAEPPRPLAYETPATPEDAAIKAGKIIKGMTDDQAFAAVWSRARQESCEAARAHSQTESSGEKTIQYAIISPVVFLPGTTEKQGGRITTTITVSFDAKGHVIDFTERK